LKCNGGSGARTYPDFCKNLIMLRRVLLSLAVLGTLAAPAMADSSGYGKGYQGYGKGYQGYGHAPMTTNNSATNTNVAAGERNIAGQEVI
jgi:hypothetical protein